MKNHKLLNRCFSGLLAVSMLTSQFTGVMALEHADHDHHVHDETCTLDHEHDVIEPGSNPDHVEEVQPELPPVSDEENIQVQPEVETETQPDLENLPDTDLNIDEVLPEDETVTGEEVVITEEETAQEEVSTKENKASVNVNPDEYESDIERFVKTVRQKMVNRETRFNYKVQVGLDNRDPQEVINWILYSVHYRFTEHTGVGNEGEYLENSLSPHPDFWYDCEYVLIDGVMYFDVQFNYTYATSKEDENFVTAELNKIYSSFSHLTDPAAKAKSIYTWITRNFTYTEKSDQRAVNMADVLRSRKANDTDLAVLMYRMLLDNGIDNVLAFGGDLHSRIGRYWNLVSHPNGNSYYCDVRQDLGFTESAWNSFMRPAVDFAHVNPYASSAFTAKYPVGNDRIHGGNAQLTDFQWSKFFNQYVAFIPNPKTGQLEEKLIDDSYVPEGFTAPTCTAPGVERYRAYITPTGVSISDVVEYSMVYKSHETYFTKIEWDDETLKVDVTISCQECGYSDTVTAQGYVTYYDSPDGCIKGGYASVYADVEFLDADGRIVDSFVNDRLYVKPQGHVTDRNFVPTWSEDYKSVQLSSNCNNCGEPMTEPGIVKVSDSVKPGCETDGAIYYDAYSIRNRWAGYAVKKVSKLGHNYQVKSNWNKTANGYSFDPVLDCSRCDFHSTASVKATRLDQLTIQATYTKTGRETYEATAKLWLGDTTLENQGYRTVTERKTFETPMVSHDIINGTCKICGENFVSFNDIAPNNWYYGHVVEAYSRGLMSGTNPAAGEFSPLGTLTRGQVITILYRMAGSPKTAYEPVFTDVKDGLFFSEPIMWAAKAGITTGYAPDANGSVRFGPSDPITREQLAVFLYNFAGLNGKDTSQRADLETMFPDGRYVSVWAKDAMSWLVATGMVEGVVQNGVWMAAPSMKCNRAMMAKLSVMIDDYIAA